jgi:hypothetical protein
MNDGSKATLTLITLAVLFMTLKEAFVRDLWGRVEPLDPIPLVDDAFTNTATVRMSAAELIRTEGDTSGLQCYACHEEKKKVELHLDANQHVILPEEHNDLVMRHGRNNRNDNCFNCHDADKLTELRLRDGRLLPIEQSTPLCASCHGPTFRDWEAGVHGRTSGFWDRTLGPATRQDCVSCHDPHNPAFPPLPPAPAPNRLHPDPQSRKSPSHE